MQRTLEAGTVRLMVFEPSFMKIGLGGTVKFLASDRGQNVETIGAVSG